MNKFKYIFFDLDGTLIDTIPFIVECFNYTFMHHFGETRPEEETISYIGMPLINHFKAIYPGQEDELAKTYRAYNENKQDNCIAIFIGIFDLIKELYEKGIILAVVTSKKKDLAIRGLKLFNLMDYFLFVNGSEDSCKHKPYGDPLIKAMEKAKVTDKNEVLYVGDSPLDILCARDAGIKSAAVAWTYSPRIELEKVNPDIFLEKPDDLLKYVCFNDIE
jgi:pyrophosphatase PpaX